MSQSDSDATQLVYYIENDYRMLRKVSTGTSTQETVTKIIMDLLSVESTGKQIHQRVSLFSGAPAEHLTVRETSEKSQKFEDEN